MRDERWTTVTESQFEHERRGLKAIQRRLPDDEPWRAWSNFTFTANSGHVREVDLLVTAPAGVFLIELKDWHGSVSGGGRDWIQTTPGGSNRRHSNPLHLANQKAKELAGLIQSAVGARPRIWVGEAVCFTDDKLRLLLPAADLNGVFTVKQLAEMLGTQPRDARFAITAEVSRKVAQGLQKLGIAPLRRAQEVGGYLLDAKAFDAGATWADYAGRHTQLHDLARVRVFLSERGASDSERASAEKAAAREAAVLSRFRHPGAVAVKNYLPSGHPAGPALLFDYHPDTLRLDDYLVSHGEELDLQYRLRLVRQLAETIRSAHSRRIHHRALSAHAVHVIPRDRGPRGQELSQTQRWLAPRLEIADWQIAAGGSGSGHSGGRRLTQMMSPSSLSALHVAEQADPYLAPELTAAKADPVRLDVYGLGVLAYLLVTGRAPGASQAEVLRRLESGEALRPSALVDGLDTYVDELVEASTAFNPAQRVGTVDDFMEMLECVELSFAPETLEASEAPDPSVSRDSDSGDADNEQQPEPEPEPERDPLEAVAGDVLAGCWEVERRLGTGSTARAFLVRDLAAEPNRNGTRPPVVLKIALNEAKHPVLEREAEVLRRIHQDSRIIGMVEPGPLTIGGRRVLALEYVGDAREQRGDEAVQPRRREDTVARQLRETGRLVMDQLEKYGQYLFGAVEHLEAEGIWHRDLKPDNIAIRIRPNGTRQLVLIDFSLAGYPAKELEAGTEGYLDPFLGSLQRGAYDAHAERYALAVTLHEMASRELPRWGDGSVTARQTDAQEWPVPKIEADAFEPELRAGLVKFFRKALAREVKDRFQDLVPMQRAWQQIFIEAQNATAPSSGHGTGTPPIVEATPEAAAGAETGKDNETDSARIRDEQAAVAKLTTHLSVAGLSASAQSQLYAMGLSTVGDVLGYSARKFLTAPGMGSRTRQEIQQRQKEWNARLRQPVTPTSRTARKEADQEFTDLERAVAETVGGKSADEAYAQLSLDALAARLVPAPATGRGGSNETTREGIRLLLRLPDEQGRWPEGPVWARQADVAKTLGVTTGRIPQIVKKARERWNGDAALTVLREQVIELLAERGRVAPVIELADALIARRGSPQYAGKRDRRMLALALLRALAEREQYDTENKLPLLHYFHPPAPRGTGPALGLLAIDVRDGVDGPDTPTKPALQEYAVKLGAKADRLADLESLPTAATVLTDLGAVAPPPGVLGWDERRIAEIAAAASNRAALTPRLEVYPRDLDLVRALRITQAGMVAVQPGVEEERQPGLTVDAVHKQVLTRFPDLGSDPLVAGELPTGAALVTALRKAGFDLKLETRYDGVLRLLPNRAAGAGAGDSQVTTYGRTGSAVRSSSVAGRQTGSKYDADRARAAAARAEQQLVHDAGRDGLRVLTVPARRAHTAARLLGQEPYGAEPLSLTGLFLDELHAMVDGRPRPTWQTVVEADAAAPGTADRRNLEVVASRAWNQLEPRLAARLEPGAGDGPLLLTEAAVLARYDALDVLGRLADLAREGRRPLWLLVAQSDPSAPPRLAGKPVPYQAALGEWIHVPDAWVAGHLTPQSA
ncbi:BREX system serine/threonine kinase PglW [Streptomyces sp. NPDC056723]|uniref:BREX system serine/threonine kinase PglW n=1 Tax=Streptomyces sp. NPDC056723 TaxID=3345925 RepID=UPI003694A05D